MMTLEDRITALEKMSAAGRKEEWQKTFGTSPPPAFGSGLLARAIAYRLQEKARGGLSKSELRRFAKRNCEEQQAVPPPVASRLEPGTLLSRTWHAEVHEVLVLEEGFVYRARTYSSLTTIAKIITGVGWSGPRFFGLKSARTKHTRSS